MADGTLQGRLAATCVFLVLGVLAPLCQASAALPPLVGRELFFGEPEISGVQISPDGKFLAFLKVLNGTRNIWVKRVSDSFENARPLTAGTQRPIEQFFWSRDGRYILFAQDANGDENFNIYAVSPTGAAAARNLTNTKDVSARIYGMSKRNTDVLYIGLNDRDKAWHDLYSVRISTGKRELLRKNDLRAVQWLFDLEGNLRLAMRWAENGDKDLLRLEQRGFTKIYGCTVSENCSPLQFHADGRRVYMASNHGADLTRLVLVDVQSGGEELVESDPENHVDLGPTVFSARTDQLLATVYRDDQGSRWLWRDPLQKADFDRLRLKLPNKELEISASADESLWVVRAQADIEPGETYLFDRRTKQLSLQFREFAALPRSVLARTVPVSYPSSDGLRIPAYLTLPKGVAAKSLPMIVMPHGGPWARIHWGYSSFAQFFANRGIAVLQPNYRGSTGYGQKYLNVGNREWGAKMQDDITWGVRYLVEQGIADPGRVGIFGESYGGYTALAGAAFTPDLYTAAASLAGPSNLPGVLDSLTAFAEPARKMFYERIGDPTTAAGRAQLERQSPLSSVGKIKVPLFIAQGANDPRVKQADSDQIVQALRDRGVPVQYLVAPDEGHVMGVALGFAHPINNQAIFAALEKFFAQRLKTRYQDSMAPEVAQRLADLTSDPRPQ
jgi:dipeptidyl aminopeptidase/acylaminoacyl peptidase